MKRHLIWLFCLLAIFVLSGCTGNYNYIVKGLVPQGSGKATNSSSEDINYSTNNTGGEKVIVVDAGGGTGNYYSTKSMVKSDANPYPYNELRVLADQWEKLHPGVKIQILDTTFGGDPQRLIPLFIGKKAPDIVYMNMGAYKNMIVGKDWVIPSDSYLEKPNKYVPGNKHWIDQFNKVWVDALRSPDGHLYWVGLDTIPIGIIYNKDMFEKAGIDKIPETFGEFMDAQKKLREVGVIPYLPLYHWYDIFLGGCFMNSYLPKMDVLVKDGVIDNQEFARGFTKGIFSFDSPQFVAYLKFVKEKTKYYPKGWMTANALDLFLNGKVGMIEGISIHMRTISDDKSRKFDFGIMPYPIVSKEDSPYGGIGVVRGDAGYSTTWLVTNTTKVKGTTDLAFDFLQFLTEPHNNSLMVNKLGTATPAVNGAEPLPLFKPLYDAAIEDQKKGFVDWHTFALWDSLSLRAHDQFETNYYPGYILGKYSLKEMVDSLTAEMKISVQEQIRQNHWDTSKW